MCPHVRVHHPVQAGSRQPCVHLTRAAVPDAAGPGTRHVPRRAHERPRQDALLPCQRHRCGAQAGGQTWVCGVSRGGSWGWGGGWGAAHPWTGYMHSAGGLGGMAAQEASCSGKQGSNMLLDEHRKGSGVEWSGGDDQWLQQARGRCGAVRCRPERRASSQRVVVHFQLRIANQKRPAWLPSSPWPVEHVHGGGMHACRR